MRPRGGRAWAVGLALLACAAGVADARAQGRALEIEPITSETFDRWVQRLGLSYDTRVRAESLHEEYKRAYRAYRDGPLAAFRDREFEDSIEVPAAPAERLEAELRANDRLLARLRSIEARLFDDLAAILPPEDRARLDRLRRARERQYFQGGLFTTINVDLAAEVASLSLAPDEAAAVEPIIRAYERALTEALEVAAEAERRVRIESLAAVAEFSLLAEEAPDLSARSPLFDAVVAARAEARRGVFKRYEEAIEGPEEVTATYAARIASALPPSTRQEFLATYRRRAFPRVYPDAESIAGLVAAAVARPDLPPATKRAIEGAAAAHRGPYEELNRRLEAWSVELDSPFATFDLTRAGELSAAIRAGLERRRRLNDEAAAAVLALVDDSIARDLEARRGPIVTTDPEPPETTTGSFVRATPPRKGLLGLPRPMDRAEFDSHLRRLGIEGDARAIAELHFADHRRALDTALEERFRPRFDTLRARRLGSAEEPGDAAELARLRREATETAGRHDERLFDRLAPLVPQDRAAALDDVRLARERALVASTIDGGAGWSGWADLAATAREAGLDPRAWDALAPYERATAPLLREWSEIEVEREQLAAAERRYLADPTRDERDRRARLDRYRRQVELDRRRHQVVDRLEAEAWRGLERVSATLPPDDAAALAKAFRRRYFPHVYPDPEDASPVLERAAALADLDAGQRAALVALRATHRAEHDRLNEAMLAAGDPRRPVRWFDPAGDGRGAAAVRLQRLLREDRREWNATVLRRVRALLREEQASRVPGLLSAAPEPSARAAAGPTYSSPCDDPGPIPTTCGWRTCSAISAPARGRRTRRSSKVTRAVASAPSAWRSRTPRS